MECTIWNASFARINSLANRVQFSIGENMQAANITRLFDRYTIHHVHRIEPCKLTTYLICTPCRVMLSCLIAFIYIYIY